MLILSKNFYKGMLLQEFYKIFGASNLSSEDLITEKYRIRYLFYYREKENETYIFTFQFRKTSEGENFLLDSFKQTPLKSFYVYENRKNLASKLIEKLLSVF